MNCLQCGTWNPEDKRVCWRCQADLPKPVEKKPRRPALFLGLPVWAWIMLILLAAFMFFGTCMGPVIAPAG
jgi:predicted nucleic acid-binding Zn ribbon protein